jgi:KTSC domain
MEMKPVNSSNVAAIGYENETLSVRFKDGAEYEYPGVSQRQYDDLMSAPSKGRALNGLIAVRAGVTLKSKQPLAQTPEQATARPIHTSQAEGCCAKLINNDSLSGALDKLAVSGTVWSCPKCGTEYQPKIFGPLVNWEAQADVLVFKL